MQSESEIQQACIQWFQYAYPQLWQDGMLYHNANEGIRPGGQGRRIKREGLRKGVADLCLSVPRKGYGALYIEMKSPVDAYPLNRKHGESVRLSTVIFGWSAIHERSLKRSLTTICNQTNLRRERL